MVVAVPTGVFLPPPPPPHHAVWADVVEFRCNTNTNTPKLQVLVTQLTQLCAAQVCSELRAKGITIPIVAMTGNVDPRSVETFKRAGFSALLAKPFSEVRCMALSCGHGIASFCWCVSGGSKTLCARVR